jgi:hypothetical protein
MVTDFVSYYAQKGSNTKGEYPFKAVVDCYNIATKKVLEKEGSSVVQNKRPY